MLTSARGLISVTMGSSLFLLFMTQGCEEPAPTITPTPIPSQSSGELIENGKRIPYEVDIENTRLNILVVLTDGCFLPFHNHVIESTSNEFSFSLNVDDPSASTFEAIVSVPGLEADLPENDILYPQTEDNNFSEDERADIESSMNDAIDAEHYDTMTFRASDLTTLYGNGTATVEVEIKGIPSELEMTGAASIDSSGRITVKANGVLDGTPYGIYSGFGASCVSSLMPLDLDMVLVPVE